MQNHPQSNALCPPLPISSQYGKLFYCLVATFALLAQHPACAKDEHEPANQTTPSPGAGFEDVDRALFFELVKLAKFNVHFHMEANRHQKWRLLTYPIGRESGTALTFSATLIDLRQQIKGLDNPARISRNQLKDAVSCAITGNAISASASALELAQNTWVMLKAKEMGYSPRRSLAFVKNVVTDTDRLLEKREQLARDEPLAQRRQVIEMENRLVRRIRQQLLFEFATWSGHSRDQAWRENTFFAIDSLQNFTRMGAGILAMKAFETQRLARPSVVCALTANSVATLNPIIRNLAGIAIRKHQERILAAQIPCQRPVSLSSELEEFQQKLAMDNRLDGHQDWLRKVAALNYRTEKADIELNRETREIERYRQVAQQQSISGPLIGLTGVTSSTLATVAVFGYAHDIDTANKLGFAGRITQGTGQAYSLVNTPYTIIKGIIKNRQLKKRGESPTQLLEQRLARLNRYSGAASDQ